MPTTRKSTGSARGRGVPAKGQSTLLSFSSKVTKSVPNDAKKAIISPAVAKVEPAQDVKSTEDEKVEQPGTKELEKEAGDELEEEEEENEPEEEPVPEKSEAELQAEKISDAQIKKYWKGIESQWARPRVHQEGLSQSEKVLRYFDVSSQYGPCIGIPRMKRWTRAERLGLNPPIEVLAVLLQEDAKGTHAEKAHMDAILNSSSVEAS